MYINDSTVYRTPLPLQRVDYSYVRTIDNAVHVSYDMYLIRELLFVFNGTVNFLS